MLPLQSLAVGVIMGGLTGQFVSNSYSIQDPRGIKRHILERWGLTRMTEPVEYAVRQAYQDSTLEAGMIGGVMGALVMFLVK